MTDARAPRPLGLALWNLRLFGLFLVGPLSGLAIAGATFGMPLAMRWLAVAMGLFCIALFAILVRGEYGRLTRATRR